MLPVRRLSIARFLSLALVGLTLALAAVAALAVGSLYAARQQYEDELARSYAGEVRRPTSWPPAWSRRRSCAPGAAGRRAPPGRGTFQAAAEAARQTASGDAVHGVIERRRLRVPRARRGRAGTGPGTGRRATAQPRAGPRRRRPARGPCGGGRAGAPPDARRAAARDAPARTRRALVLALVAGALALLAALALVSLLVAGLRRPMAYADRTSRRLAGGDLQARVQPDGPPELQELATAFNAMAEDLENAEGRVEDSRRRLAAVIESLGTR